MAKIIIEQKETRPLEEIAKEYINIEKLSEAITKMIEDDNMRIEMSEKAVKNSERFLIKKICSEWNELFEKLEN